MSEATVRDDAETPPRPRRPIWLIVLLAVIAFLIVSFVWSLFIMPMVIDDGDGHGHGTNEKGPATR